MTTQHTPTTFVDYALTRGYGYEFYFEIGTNEIHVLRPSKAEDCVYLVGPLTFEALAKVQG